MTIIEQIKAEIERLKAVQFKRIQEGDLVDAEPYDKNEAYNELLDFLTTLEPEKPMNQKGLEREIERCLWKLSDDPSNEELRMFARNFYDLGCRRTAEKYDEIEYNRQRAEESPLPEDTVLFNKGVAEGKRLMMEEAVEGEVVKDWDNNLSVKSRVICGFKFGEKVRVIVLPKED